MAFTQISGTIPQYFKETINGGAGPSSPASGYYIKFYDPSNNPINMASDKDGGGLLDKATLDSSGYPINGSGARFTPFIDQQYKIALFITEDDANNNAFGSDDWFDGPFFPYALVTSQAIIPISTVPDLRSVTGQSDADIIFIAGHTVDGFGGGRFDFSDSSTATDDNGSIIEPDTGTGAWLRVTETGIFSIDDFGAYPTNTDTGNQTAVIAAIAAADLLGGGGYKGWSLHLPDERNYIRVKSERCTSWNVERVQLR